jgi:hypothetical protein
MSQQHPKETLKFKIGLSGTYWGKKPQYSILIDDKVMASGFITEPSDSIEYILFSCELDEDSTHQLKIRLENKEDEDTLKNPPVGDPYVIEKDMLLNIKSIEIDDFELNDLLWTASEFIPDDPYRLKLTHCVNLGWNGSYIIKFSCPVYFWLLESL